MEAYQIAGNLLILTALKGITRKNARERGGMMMEDPPPAIVITPQRFRYFKETTKENRSTGKDMVDSILMIKAQVQARSTNEPNVFGLGFI